MANEHWDPGKGGNAWIVDEGEDERLKQHDFMKKTEPKRIPPKTWTRVGVVNAVQNSHGLYIAQIAFDVPGGGRLQFRFVRQPSDDGTGDQDYRLPDAEGVFNLTHVHSVSGFKGEMEGWVWCSKEITTRYRIMKAIKGG